MTLWTFDLRSNDSDLEDEEETIPPLQNMIALDTHPQHGNTQRAQQKQTDKELEELFGTKDEDSVEYKPNPWSIAKINANARNIAPVTKPKSKKIWKPTNNPGSKSSGLERFWESPRGLLKDGCGAPETAFSARNKPLRDSISDALRRGGPAATASLEQDLQPQARATSVAEKPTERLNSQLTDTARLPEPHQSLLGFNQKPILTGCNIHELGAYIRDKHSNMPVFDKLRSSAAEEHGHPGTSSGFLPRDSYIPDVVHSQGSEDTNTLDDNSNSTPYQMCDEEAPNSGFMHTPTRSPSGLQWKGTPAERTPNRFRTASPEPGLGWISQNQVHLASPYSDGHNGDSQVPSPTMQLIAKFAAPEPNELAVFERSKYSGSDIYCDDSPIFSRAPLSTTTESTQHTSSALRQAYKSYTPERTLHRTHERPFATPPRKTITNCFDPDDKPFWSTLPTPPNSKLKPPADGIKTSRFRLPGSFLGSSPLSGNSGRTLYKPPPLKRARSKGDEELATKWKVTRVG
ncbi:unnamed protein product [Rhizoctonia solani]|uniref:Uncharacterized protein n=1 Tax=Rhizoctonia solani TaxID=456999 RepID=A0A8H3H6V3_9AGAM|nr:unnamed protein product [Rhizoctonia solani]